MTSLPILDQLNISVIKQAPLVDYTTFRLGGCCRALLNCHTPEELERTVGKLIEEKLPFILIGGGSNLVVSDEGLDCLVIRYLSKEPLIKQEGNDLIVSGSTVLDDLAHFAAEAGLEGLNYTTGIPGTVGGAVVGNAGAFGKQVGDVLVAATLLDVKTGKKKIVRQKDLGFAYRDSDLKKSGDILLDVRFALVPGQRDNLIKERHDILNIRAEKHPHFETEPCAGSFFRNIEPTSRAGNRQAAGYFLEQAGGKSLKYGGAVIFAHHANIIIKSKDCTAQDVFELSKMMAQLAKDKFNLDLVREVRFVGNFQGKPAEIKDMIW